MDNMLHFTPMNSSNSVKVSVIMPCYNNGSYVAKAIESVLAQTYGNWELVIVNDGSIDNSDEVIREYADKDIRIQYIRRENAGVSAARNRGVLIASGYYVCFLDADDWLAPECLQNAVSIFQRHNNLRLFYLKNQFVGSPNDGK